ncbi:MAG: polysulfide reductase NrfD [Deltaproteobacteria bacterium]|nr:polysulfide reductase NrfD [Deltaproteobacteria bacterium]
MKKFFWVTLVIGLGIGLIGVYERLTTEHLQANYGSIIPWGLWVALYIYFVGLSAGAFLISSLVYVFQIKKFEPLGKLSVFVALVTLFMALIFIWFDLGHMERAWRVLLTPNFHSMMAWMVWLYTIYFLVLICEAYFLLRSDFLKMGGMWKIFSLGFGSQSSEGIARDRKYVRILGSIGVPLAIMFHGGVGALFGVVSARPYWHSGLYPIIFLISALASGGALITFIFIFIQKDKEKYSELIQSLGQLVLYFLAVDILFNISEILVGLYGAIPHHIEPFLTVMKGPFWWVFWVVQLCVGMMIPVLLLSYPKTKKNISFVFTAVLCVLVGFIGVRLNIVIPALASEEIKGLVEAYRSARFSTYYFPSLMEWLVSVFIISLGIFVFTLGLKFLPLQTKERI